MNKRKDLKKLNLHKEEVIQLNEHEMNSVRGGIIPTTTYTTDPGSDPYPGHVETSMGNCPTPTPTPIPNECDCGCSTIPTPLPWTM